MVQLRDGLVGSDGLGGLILAASGSVTLPAGSPEGFYRFEFPHRALTPLQTYVAELVVTEGGLDLGTNQDNPYAGGQSLSKGLPSFILAPTTDQVFREGVYAVSVPVPGAVLLGMLGLGFAGLRLRRVS